MKAQFIVGEFEVGQVVGRLTITSLVPFQQVCACGAQTKWKRIDLIKNGVRSCGCGRPPGAPIVPGAVFGIFKVIERAEGPRKWVVECKRCKQQKTVGEPNLRYGRQRRCSQCD